MKMRPTVLVEAQIEITDLEAELLHEMASYGLVEYFTTKCSTKWKAEFIRETLSRLSRTTAAIIAARDAGLKEINEHIKKGAV